MSYSHIDIFLCYNARMFYITTSDPQRAARWERLFGTDRLPVLSAASRWDVVDGRERPCYDLDLSQLHPAQRQRLACYVARRTGRPYAEVRVEIDTAVSWPVRAAGCVVVEVDEATAVPSPLLLLLDGSIGALFARKHSSLPIAV